MRSRAANFAIGVGWLVLATVVAASQPLFESNLEAVDDAIFADGWEPPAPLRPVAAAGDDQNVAVRAEVVLDGSASRTAGGRALGFRWTLESRPEGSETALVDPTSMRPRLVPDVRGAYLVALVVSDGRQDSLPDRVMVRAFDNFGIDSDGDGLGDALERSLGLDPFNEDSFGDGIRDPERDLDNDGLTIRQELLIGTDPIRADTDGNGTNDGDEDLDRDGLSNREEFQLGTRPLSADSDGDGWPDGAEVDGLSNPLDAQSRPQLAFTPPLSGHGLVRVDAADSGALGLNTVVAQPITGHGLVRVDAGDSGGLGLNTVVAQPFTGHGLVRVDTGDTGGLSVNTVVAQPAAGHGVVRVDVGDPEGLPLNVVVAHPPVQLRRPE